MLDELKQIVHGEQLEEVDYLVNERSLTGQLFLKAVGFKSVVVLNGCGDDGEESASLMRFVSG